MDKENLLSRQSYIDGQLSSEEEAERLFAQRLDKVLNKKVPCPDLLWEKVKGNVLKRGRAGNVFSRGLFKFSSAALILIVITAGLFVYNRSCCFCVELTGDLACFCKDADVPGDIDKVCSFLSGNNMHVDIAGLKSHNEISDHKVELLGARMTNVKGRPAAQIYFSCCDQPVAVFVLNVDDGIDLKDFKFAEDSGEHNSAIRRINKYSIIAFGVHPPKEVLDLFS